MVSHKVVLFFFFLLLLLLILLFEFLPLDRYITSIMLALTSVLSFVYIDLIYNKLYSSLLWIISVRCFVEFAGILIYLCLVCKSGYEFGNIMCYVTGFNMLEIIFYFLFFYFTISKAVLF